jgi:hypothetical protein
MHTQSHTCTCTSTQIAQKRLRERDERWTRWAGKMKKHEEAKAWASMCSTGNNNKSIYNLVKSQWSSFGIKQTQTSRESAIDS